MGAYSKEGAYVREGAYSKKYGEFLSFLYYIYYSTTSNCWSYIFGLKTDSWQCRLVGKNISKQNSKQKQLLCFAINFVVCLLWVSWLRWFCELHCTCRIPTSHWDNMYSISTQKANATWYLHINWVIGKNRTKQITADQEALYVHARCGTINC